MVLEYRLLTVDSEYSFTSNYLTVRRVDHVVLPRRWDAIVGTIHLFKQWLVCKLNGSTVSNVIELLINERDPIVLSSESLRLFTVTL